jgi:hypothetical protein
MMIRWMELTSFSFLNVRLSLFLSRWPSSTTRTSQRGSFLKTLVKSVPWLNASYEVTRTWNERSS